MSESEQEQNSAPRFSKAILGRILAVGFFVVLGTFAVIQSMRGTPINAINATVNLSSDDSDEDTKPNGGPVTGAEKKISSGIANAKIESSTSVGANKAVQTKPTGFEPTTFAQSKNFPTKSPAKPNNNSFAGTSLGTPPPTKSFGPIKTFTPPDKKTSTSLPDKETKLAAKPPVRYAQNNSGIPILGNQNGFGERPKAPASNQPKLPTNTFGDDSVARKPNTAAKSASAPAQQLKTKVTDSANDLLRQVKEQANQKTKDAVTALKQNTGGNFGPSLPKTGGPFGGPANPVKKTFGAPVAQTQVQPKVSSDFGPRPKSVLSTENKSTTVKPNEKNNDQFGGNGAPTTVRPITSRITNNTNTNPPKTNNPFGVANPVQRSVAPLEQRPNVPSNQRSLVPAQPVSAGISNARPTSSPGFGGQPGSSNRPSSTNQLGNINAQNIVNNRMGASTSISPNDNSELTKNVPGDRELEGMQAPALTIEKLSPREIQVNQTANFEIVVKNVGRVTAEDVYVLDEIPAGTKFEGSTPQPTRSSPNRTLEWNIGQLRPGQEKRIQLQLKPIQPGEIGSVARVTFATQASMRTLVTKPVLEIVHQTSPTHLIGDSVILDVLVTNKGDGPAKNVMIQQDVPQQLEFPDGLPGGSRGIEFEIGTLLPGKSRRVKLALKAADVGRIQNIMFASADGGLRAKHELPIEVVAPKLIASSTGATRTFLNRTVTHEFSVVNKGTAKATNVELVARLPRGLRYIEANNQGRYDPNTNAVYWSLAELDQEIEAKVEVKTTPSDVGSQPIKFESTADLQIRANVEQALSVEHLVDVFFDIDDVVDPIAIGGTTSYRLRVVNQGTKAATNVQFQVDFPPGLLPTSVDGSLRHNIRGQQIVFEPINSMNTGDEISIVINGKGQSVGDHRVIVSMQTDGRSTPVSKQESTRVYSDR